MDEFNGKNPLQQTKKDKTSKKEDGSVNALGAIPVGPLRKKKSVKEKLSAVQRLLKLINNVNG